MGKKGKKQGKKSEQVICEYCQKSFIHEKARAAHVRVKHSSVAGNRGSGIENPSSTSSAGSSPVGYSSPTPTLSVPADLKEDVKPVEGHTIEVEAITATMLPENLPRPKEEAEVRYKAVLSEDELGGILDVVFDRVASLRGEFWRLSESEKKAILPPLTKVANKYMGSKLGKWGDEVALLLALGTVLIGKFMQDKAKNKNPFFGTPDVTNSQAEPSATSDSVQPDFSNQGQPSTEDILSEYPGLTGGRR